MPTQTSPLAGKPARQSMLVDVAKLISAYYAEVPDPTVSAQRVAFGTSGHRRSADDCSFNEWHLLAITQAICQYREVKNIDGPLFLGIDTHALSVPASASALEVLAANGVHVMLATNDEYTPTPAISHAILTHNRGRSAGWADGIVVTPSHNPPRDGGFKYNPPHGGPAGQDVTDWIEAAANRLLEQRLEGVIDYLFQHRPQWDALAAVGKTVVSTSLIDRLAARLGRELYETPVGFKWFAARLLDGTLGFSGEESAGATFLRRDGSVWTTDKDGITAALLAAEITAVMGRDPGALYADLANEFGNPVANRIEAPATTQQKKQLAALAPGCIGSTELAGEKILRILNKAPGNDVPIGGIKVIAGSGWFAARPSGTEDLYKIYAESFSGAAHLRRILKEAQTIVDAAIAPASAGSAPAVRSAPRASGSKPA